MTTTKRLLSVVNGIESWLYTNTDTGEMGVGYSADAQSVVDYNKDLRDGPRAGKGEDMWHVAEIPTIMLLKWMNEENINVWKDRDALEHLIKKKIKDPEFSQFRIAGKH